MKKECNLSSPVILPFSLWDLQAQSKKYDPSHWGGLASSKRERMTALFRFETPAAVPQEICDLLFVDWARRLAQDLLGITQYGSGTSANDRTFTFGDPAGAHFVLSVDPESNWSIASRNEIPEGHIRQIVLDARARVEASDWGDDQIYEISMRAEAFKIGPLDALHMMRMLGDQRRASGQRRLSDRAILEFKEEREKGESTDSPFPPKTNIRVLLFVPGPIAGDLTRNVATGMAEAIAATCALALGRVVHFDPPMFPALDPAAEEARKLRMDPKIGGLARDGVSLDLFGEFAARGGGDGVLRLRGALLSYHAALQQPNHDVATMLMVTAIEALLAPTQPWKTEQVTKRFIQAMIELCPEAVDEACGHANVEQAFAFKKKGGQKKQRKDLLDRIYELRSIPTHSGIGLSGGSILTMLADPGSMKLAILSDLSRAALLKFIEAPRSFLIGHPAFTQSDGD